MKLNISDQKSIYLQIANTIENEILNDLLKENERVLSTNEIARVNQINPATAAKGVNVLVDDGVLFKKRGIGMFVSPNAKKMIIKKRKASFNKDFITTMICEAKALDLSTDEVIDMIVKGFFPE